MKTHKIDYTKGAKPIRLRKNRDRQHEESMLMVIGAMCAIVLGIYIYLVYMIITY